MQLLLGAFLDMVGFFLLVLALGAMQHFFQPPIWVHFIMMYAWFFGGRITDHVQKVNKANS